MGNESDVKPERPREPQCPGESCEGLVSNSRNGEKWFKESWIMWMEPVVFFSIFFFLLLGPGQQSKQSRTLAAAPVCRVLSILYIWVAEVDLRPKSPQTKVGILFLTVSDRVAPGHRGA